MAPRLLAELRRLFLPPDAPAADTALAARADAAGRVRVLALALASEAGWAPLAATWQGVQTELGLPAPAIAVDGRGALQLWFSLAQPVEPAEARAVLAGLRTRFLAEVPAHRLRQWPPTEGDHAPGDEADALGALPPRPVDAERWSAFVSPDLAPVFADTPWLEIPPGDDAQASLLARLQPASAGAWAEACARLAPRPVPAAEAPAPPPAAISALTAQAAAGGAPHAATAPAGSATPDDTHPAGDDRAAARRFLRTVMDDPGAPLAQRIEAARALLLGPGQAG